MGGAEVKKLRVLSVHLACEMGIIKPIRKGILREQKKG